MTKKNSEIPSVKEIPPVKEVSEAGPMETATLGMMACFGEIIYEIRERIASVFKKEGMLKDRRINKSFFLENLDKMENLNHQLLADLFIKRGKGELVLAYLDKFRGIDYNDIIDKLLETKEKNIVVYYFDKFKGLNKNTIEKLVKIKYGGENALLYLDKWIGSEHINYEAVKHLFGFMYYNNGRHIFDILVDKLDKIDGLDIEAVNDLLGIVYVKNEELWQRKYGHISKTIGMYGNIKTFMGTIKTNRYPRKIFKGIFDNFDNFDNLSRIQFAKILYKNGSLLKYLNQFKDGEHKQIALELIKDGGSGFVVKYINKFKGVDNEVLEKLIEAGYGDAVAKYPEKFGPKEEKIRNNRKT